MEDGLKTMIDIEAQLGAVRREVRSVELDGRTERVVIVEQTYPTDPADLWDALTSAERIPRWFLPISGELRIGGRYQFDGNAGGSIERCEPPRLLQVTWEGGGDVSWVTVRLVPGENQTTLELEHRAPIDDAKWTEFGPGAVGVGWDGALLGLAQHMSGAPAVDPSNALQWLQSAEGRSFLRGSSEAWSAADVAGGENETVAQGAAARTAIAYGAAPDID